MGLRREARQRAVQFLFQQELNPADDLETALEAFWRSQQAAARMEDHGPAHWGSRPDLPPPTTHDLAIRRFAEPHIRGVLGERPTLDEWIQRYCQNWAFHRIAVVDRNILRLAIHEMLHRRDIPAAVSINEAIEIAKTLSLDDSGKFVNGILDQVRRELESRPKAKDKAKAKAGPQPTDTASTS